MTFTKAELKAYPLLNKIERGLRVVAIDCDYEGLYGTIDEIRYGQDKETENDCILEIIVDFEEPEHGSLEYLYPHLNGTGIGQVIMSEDILGFFFEEAQILAQTADGKAICPDCHKPLEIVRETQYDDIVWTFQNGEYVKENLIGSSDGKRCDQCNAVIDDGETVFAY